jgi:hypothetical protein
MSKSRQMQRGQADGDSEHDLTEVTPGAPASAAATDETARFLGRLAYRLSRDYYLAAGRSSSEAQRLATAAALELVAHLAAPDDAQQPAG